MDVPLTELRIEKQYALFGFRAEKAYRENFSPVLINATQRYLLNARPRLFLPAMG
jgi:hypothetical protein